MHVKSAKLVFRLPYVSSLKQKRQIARSMMDKAKNKFNASIAEVDLHDVHNSLAVGVSVAAASANHAGDCLEEIIRFMDDFVDNNGHGELIELVEYT